MTADFSLLKWTQTVSFTALLVSLGSAAHADRKSPAPISFSDNTSTRGQAAAPVAPMRAAQMPTSPLFQTRAQGAELAGAPLEANARTRRVEFRYPDQPDTYYSANGARHAGEGSQPIAFSSAEAAISVAKAEQMTVTRDPAISAGGFDARAAAAKVALAQEGAAPAPITPSKPIRIAALTSTLPRETRQPITLSKVKPLSDTPISEERGSAALYSDGFDGQPTANGEIYDAFALTAAHRTLPLPSLVHVTNVSTQKDIVVRVNDRGPFDGDNILELSPRAGEMLGIGADQNAIINLRYLGPAPVKTVENYANRSVEAESLPAIELAGATPPQPQRVAFTSPQTAVAPPPSVNTSGLFIQAGSFSDISNAQKMIARIKPFHPVSIEPARVNGSDYFRVIVGPFSDRSEADYQRQQMAFDGLADGFVVRR